MSVYIISPKESLGIWTRVKLSLKRFASWIKSRLVSEYPIRPVITYTAPNLNQKADQSPSSDSIKECERCKVLEEALTFERQRVDALLRSRETIPAFETWRDRRKRLEAESRKAFEKES